MSTAAIADEDLITVEIDDGPYGHDSNAATRKMLAFRIPNEARRPEAPVRESTTLVVPRKAQ